TPPRAPSAPPARCRETSRTTCRCSWLTRSLCGLRRRRLVDQALHRLRQRRLREDAAHRVTHATFTIDEKRGGQRVPAAERAQRPRRRGADGKREAVGRDEVTDEIGRSNVGGHAEDGEAAVGVALV